MVQVHPYPPHLYQYMNLNDYKKQALRTDYADYSDFHTGDVSPRLDYATTGLVTELAKILDLIKKSKKALSPFGPRKSKRRTRRFVMVF